MRWLGEDQRTNLSGIFKRDCTMLLGFNNYSAFNSEHNYNDLSSVKASTNVNVSS